MRNKSTRIVLGVLLLILLAIYIGGTAAARTNGAEFEQLAEERRKAAEATPVPTVEAPADVPEETAVPVETPEPTPEPVENSLPDVDLTSWEFILANPTHDIGTYEPPIDYIEGIPLDSRIIEPMREFVAAARAEGLSVYLSSGYRTYSEQTYLFNRKIGQGYSEEVAATIVARPGTSEHQTGLACDITDQYYELKDSSLEQTATYKWMYQHCQEYGFIVRFPTDKKDITGIIYEPWHFRYVGIEAATYIMENGLCLEEFLDLYQDQSASSAVQ